MIFVDTGYLLALTNRRDKLFARAAAWSESLDESLLTTEYVLVAFVNANSRAAARNRSHEILDGINQTARCTILESSTELFRNGLDLHRSRTDKDWSLTDCISFTVMQAHGVTAALSYDHHFEQAGFEALLRRDPP